MIITAKGKVDSTKEKKGILLLPGHGFTNVWSDLWWGVAGGLFLIKIWAAACRQGHPVMININNKL